MNKKHLLVISLLSLSATTHAQVNLLSFGNATFDIDSGSTAIYTQSATGITMNTTPTAGDTWYNSTSLASNWSAFPSFALRMTAGTNPGLTYSITLLDANFQSINAYSGSTVGLTSTPSLSMLSLNTAGNGDLTSVQYVQFIWGSGGSAIDTEVTEFVGVPEPSTYALLTLGALALGGYAMRRRKSA